VDLGTDALAGFNLTAAISPDGRRLVFAARGPDGKQRLATRLLDQAQATLQPGTENGSDPFFSPDGQWSDSPLARYSRRSPPREEWRSHSVQVARDSLQVLDHSRRPIP
jgi:hypothetical protein